MSKKYLTILALFVFALFLLLLRPVNNIVSNSIVTIGEFVFKVTIVDTIEKRNVGLSDHKSLSLNEGMLFVFKSPGKYSFWMKDMNFPIDIIWINEKFKIIGIKENATPQSYPESFTPSVDSLYVLEVNSGIVDKNGINIGDEVFINY